MLQGYTLLQRAIILDDSRNRAAVLRALLDFLGAWAASPAGPLPPTLMTPMATTLPTTTTTTTTGVATSEEQKAQPAVGTGKDASNGPSPSMINNSAFQTAAPKTPAPEEPRAQEAAAAHHGGSPLFDPNFRLRALGAQSASDAVLALRTG